MSSALSILDELYVARSKLDYGPMSHRTLRAFEALRGGTSQERVIDRTVGYIANLIASRVDCQPLRFCEVIDEVDWRAVRELRLRSYPVALPYLVGSLERDGSDRHDRHSLVYAAYLGDRAIATIRATPYPYEILDYVGAHLVGDYLGAGWRSEYIEWGRLLVDHEFARLHLTPALITYAGLRLLTLTPYRRYFGYTRPHVRSLVSQFALQQDTLRFKIPARGDHEYLLTKGSLGAGAVHELPKWLRRAGARLVRRPDITARPASAQALAL
jgi:hypothetical protein